MIVLAKNIVKKLYQSFLIGTLLLLSLSIFSCTSSSIKNYNEVFETKYGEEIKKISFERQNELNAIGSVKTPQGFDNAQEELVKEYREQYYPYADIAKLGDNPRENFLPNGEVYQQIKERNPQESLPSDMFFITYNTNNHPQYSYDGSEFDAIVIPPQDAYGVKTELLQKPYMMAGNNNVQRSVDRLQKRLNEENIELSKTIISEKKQLRRQQKMVKIFGENDLENSKILVVEQNKTDTKKVEEIKPKQPEIASNIKIIDPATFDKMKNSSQTQQQQ